MSHRRLDGRLRDERHAIGVFGKLPYLFPTFGPRTGSKNAVRVTYPVAFLDLAGP